MSFGPTDALPHALMARVSSYFVNGLLEISLLSELKLHSLASLCSSCLRGAEYESLAETDEQCWANVFKSRTLASVKSRQVSNDCHCLRLCLYHAVHVITMARKHRSIKYEHVAKANGLWEKFQSSFQHDQNIRLISKPSKNDF